MAIQGKKKRRLSLLLVFLPVTVLILLFPLNSLLGEYDEYQLKAKLLGEIAKQLEWPKSSDMGNIHTPFIIGIFGENPFGSELEDFYIRKELKPRKIKDKLVEIRYIKRIEEIPECHMLFISDIPRRSVTRILEFIQDKPILTISDIPDYVERGVQVNLLIRKGAVDRRRKKIPTLDIIINETAMHMAGLVPSKQLQEISEIIHPYSPYEEKARQLDPIARFITWPENSGVEDRKKPFVIAVIGQNLFDKYLDKIYKKKKIKDKPVNIRYITKLDEISDTNLLFISKSFKDNVSEIVAFTKGKPILTVGDTNGFIQRGVHINFFYDRYRLHFEVNQEAATDSGFKISYHLLKMAKTNVNF